MSMYTGRDGWRITRPVFYTTTRPHASWTPVMTREDIERDHGHPWWRACLRSGQPCGTIRA